LDLRGSIPTFIEITDGKVHDVNILDLLLIEAGAVYVMDRAYVDFARLYEMHQARAFFISIEKSNFKYRRLYSRKVNKEEGFKCDQTIVLTGFYTKKKYPEKLRRIRYYDDEMEKHLVFLTNNFTYSSEIIAQLYKERWIAVSIYLLVAIIKQRLKLDQELYTILQILSISLFEKVPLDQLFTKNDYRNLDSINYNQLKLFDL
jgi:IS4 transposase